jgi:flagellar operon protein
MPHRIDAAALARGSRIEHGQPAAKPLPKSSDLDFAKVLRDTAAPSGEGLRLSAHARQRLEARGIEWTPERQARMEQAVDQAAAKGGRESLVLMDRCAFVVSVPNRTVITAMPNESSGGAVFTNIDSAVVAQ